VAIADTEEHQKLGLSVLFEVLDFAGCNKNITAWKYLAKYLKQILVGYVRSNVYHCSS
jgi:TATA box-binding protein-associated factor RNA polymerase I subunit A